MYLTLLFAFLTLIMGIIGFFGLGDGPIYIARILFFCLIVVTTVSFFVTRGKKRKKYYD